MKILLVGNYLPDEQESMQRFADLLIDSLKPYGHEVKLIRPTVVLNRSQSSYESKGKWWGYIDKFLIFPFRLKKAARWADVVHICDHSNAHYIHAVRNKPHLITCHDVIAIRMALDSENSTIKRSGKILQNIVLRGLKKARCLACVSQNTRTELLEVAKSTSNKATVIYNGINYSYENMQLEAIQSCLASDALKPISLSNFILHVGGNQPYKNRLGLLKIYRQLRLLMGNVEVPQLVLAGKPWTTEMRDFIAKNGLEGAIIEAQDCSNEELRALYSSARVFFFPSLAEGFGWPVIEAQACGCPVLTSNFAPLTEIGGEAAIYCDPRDEMAAACALKSLLEESAAKRKSRVESGLENVQRFTPQTMIEAYLTLYQEAISTQKRNAAT